MPRASTKVARMPTGGKGGREGGREGRMVSEVIGGGVWACGFLT